MEYKRIAIVGCCGSGKSTLAKSLGEKHNIPVHHLDQIFWLPDWQQRPVEDFQKRHNEIIKDESWIIDGNSSSTMMQRFERADILIVLNYPKYLTYWRLVKRIFKHFGKTRNDMADGCHERIDFPFCWYVLRFHKTTYRKIFKIFDQIENRPEVIILNSPKETDDFLKTSC